MSIQLLFHSKKSEVNPFHRCIIDMISKKSFSLACPYINLQYLKIMIARSTMDWQVLTDIRAWLSAAKSSQRIAILDFIEAHAENFRHRDYLHAKVLLAGTKAIIGSANFTMSGICARDEMSVCVESDNGIDALNEWFGRLWTESDCVDVNKYRKIIATLPPKTTSDAPLFKGANRHVFSKIEDDEVKTKARVITSGSASFNKYDPIHIETVLAKWPQHAEYARYLMSIIRRDAILPHTTEDLDDIRYELGNKKRRPLYGEIRFYKDRLGLVLKGKCTLRDYKVIADKDRDDKYEVEIDKSRPCSASLLEHIQTSYDYIGKTAFKRS